MNTSMGEISAADLVDALEEAERLLGGRASMAAALEVTAGAIGNWKARGVPVKSCVRIERLVPSVTRRRLRPHDYAEIWPDLGDGGHSRGTAAGP